MPLVTKIRDSAGQKGTGKWTAISALDHGVPVTLIAEAVFARYDHTYQTGSDTEKGWVSAHLLIYL